MSKALIIIAFFVFSIIRLSGDVLFRATFEDWEGTLSETGWIIDTDGIGDIRRLAEDLTDQYQTQQHGERSLRIDDPNDTSYAYAKHAFPTFGVIPNHPEYMVEFYFWWERTTTADSIYLYKPTKLSNLADISIILGTAQESVVDTSDTVVHYFEETFNLVITDSTGNHNVTYKDTVLVLKGNPGCDDHSLHWHKFQVRKLFNSDTIILYIDGDSIGTYKSNSGITHPDTFLVGTIDTLQNGEGFWDDFIITTVPNGNHPRLFFSQSDIDSLKTKATNTHSTILDYSYKQMADTVITLANSCCDCDSFYYFTYENYMLYPFKQPTPYYTSNRYTAWLAINREIEAWLQVLAFSYVILDSTKYFNHTREILLALSNDWSQWTDMQYGPQNTSLNSRYTRYDAAHLVASISIAYDMIFDSLT